MLDESAEKFQGAGDAAFMARRVINAHGEFVIGLKRTSEPKGSLFSSNGPPHTFLHANRTHIRFTRLLLVLSALNLLFSQFYVRSDTDCKTGLNLHRSTIKELPVIPPRKT
jgi:hypothetical protein